MDNATWDNIRKSSKGKGWHGDTPGHREAAKKRKAKQSTSKTSRKPMCKVQEPKITHFLEKLEEESGEKKYPGGYLLKYESWYDSCILSVIDSGELDDEEAEDTGVICDYVEGESGRIIKEEWTPELKKRGYNYLKGGYNNSGKNIYGVTWALYRQVGG